MNESPWHEAILNIIRSYPAGSRLTSDEVRRKAAKQSIGQPSHPSAWGAVFCAASTYKLIKKTGRYLASTIPTNHGAVIAQWLRT